MAILDTFLLFLSPPACLSSYLSLPPALRPPTPQVKEQKEEAERYAAKKSELSALTTEGTVDCFFAARVRRPLLPPIRSPPSSLPPSARPFLLSCQRTCTGSTTSSGSSIRTRPSSPSSAPNSPRPWSRSRCVPPAFISNPLASPDLRIANPPFILQSLESTIQAEKAEAAVLQRDVGKAEKEQAKRRERLEALAPGKIKEEQGLKVRLSSLPPSFPSSRATD